MKKHLLILFLSLLTLVSCSDDNNQASGQKTGTLKGKVTTVNTHKPVGGALVFTFDDRNEIYFTRTNAMGEFEFRAPIGNRELHIQTGDGSNFRTKFDVAVEENQTQVLEEASLRLDQTARMAYVGGTYDNIEDIITDLGYTVEQLTFNQLNDYTIVSQYDIIFLNCGSIPSTQSISGHTNITNNLSQFVTNGGSLYASDWAVAYLVGGTNKTTQCDAAGGFIADATLCSINNGVMGTLNGFITNTVLANATGITTLDIDYDLGQWQKINSVDESFWEVLVRETGTNQPLMIRTNHYTNPTVVGDRVGNSENSDWVTICHYDAESDTYINITIETDEWPAHEAHGDSLGSCSGNNMSGTIYYTTFHNHANLDNGSQSILEHVILNL
ncbi:hypothetical protein [Flavobacterium sp.]|uniref:hypothetical protein n=1 Tax=Flavobacterium sp. TaxID=239 RepID=UPI002FDEDB53